MSALVHGLGGVLLAAGALLVVTGGLGLLRLPDFFSRLHAAGLTETLGAGLVIAGLMLHAGWSSPLLELVLIGAFLIATGPVAAHALAKAARHGGLEPLVGRRGEQPSSRS